MTKKIKKVSKAKKTVKRVKAPSKKAATKKATRKKLPKKVCEKKEEKIEFFGDVPDWARSTTQYVEVSVRSVYNSLRNTLLGNNLLDYYMADKKKEYIGKGKTVKEQTLYKATPFARLNKKDKDLIRAIRILDNLIK